MAGKLPVKTISSKGVSIKARLPMVVTEAGITMLPNPVPRKALSPMAVTVLGMVMAVSAGQFSKAKSLIFPILPPMVTLVSLGQL